MTYRYFLIRLDKALIPESYVTTAKPGDLMINPDYVMAGYELRVAKVDDDGRIVDVVADNFPCRYATAEAGLAALQQLDAQDPNADRGIQPIIQCPNP